MTNHPNRSKTANMRALVRKHYKDQGCDVRISQDGRVTFRHQGGDWLEGRWISEYRAEDGQVHLR